MKNKITYFTIIAMLFIGTNTAFAQTYTLKQVLDSITSNNPGLQQFQFETSASKAMSKSATSWSPLKAGIGLNEFPYAHRDWDNPMMFRRMWMLHLQQNLPQFGKQKLQQQYFQSLTSQDIDRQKTLKNTLLQEARTAYFDALINEKKISLIKQQIEQIQLLIKIQKGRLQYDKASLPGIYKAQASLSKIKVNLIELKSKILIAHSTLNTLMNRKITAPLEIDTTIQLKNTIQLNLSDSNIAKNRTDIKLISDKMSSLKIQQSIVKKSNNPAFGVSWDNMMMPSGEFMYNMMATISIPLVPWANKQYRFKRKAIGFQSQALSKQKEAKILKIKNKISNTQLQLDASKKILELYNNEVIPNYQRAYQANLNAFSENNGDIFKTITAWNEYTTVQLKYLDKLHNMIDLGIKLKAERQE